jgi:hypothetical protein
MHLKTAQVTFMKKNPANTFTCIAALADAFVLLSINGTCVSFATTYAGKPRTAGGCNLIPSMAVIVCGKTEKSRTNSFTTCFYHMLLLHAFVFLDLAVQHGHKSLCMCSCVRFKDFAVQDVFVA